MNFLVSIKMRISQLIELLTAADLAALFRLLPIIGGMMNVSCIYALIVQIGETPFLFIIY